LKRPGQDSHISLKLVRLVCYNVDGKRMEQIRSFVAIELDEELRRQLSRIQRSLKSKGIEDEVRWVNPDGIHLTLKFLGDVPASRINEIVLAVTQGREDVLPFIIGLRGVGCFPTTRRPNVIWVGVDGDTATLARLQTAIEDRLAVLGYPPEKRKFTPHLTLGRVVRRVTDSDRRRIGSLIQDQAVGSLGEMLVREVSLMKSELSPTGARYTRLAAVPLGE
jgi:2'-5' RNA ligase